MDDESTSDDPHSVAPENNDAVPTETDAGVSIPDHELLRCIGAGSYGMIWLARNVTGVYRAVKIVYRSKFKDPRPYERELSGIHKFEPISRSHEGFVDVLQVGINEERGYFYYVMELGDDITLGQKIDPRNYKPLTLAWRSPRQGKFSFDDCLQLGVALSLALAELHKHGLVHRDIKPSNIIFVNGVPKLADIGLVADFDETRSYVGTEGYMPVEGPGTPQADVYSLGKVLYEVSTGKDRNQFPELPTLLDQRPDAEKFMELNTVILQACREDFRDRYKSAWDMHAHLLLLANGKSVKRLQVLEQRLKTLKQAGRIAVLAVVIAIVIGVQVYHQWRDHIEALQKQVDASIASGNRAVETGDWLGSLPYFGEVLRLNQGKAGTELSDQLRFSSVLDRVPVLTRLWTEEREVGSVDFSRDGKRALVVQRTGGAKVYDLETGQVIGNPIPAAAYLTAGGLSPDGKRFATAGEAGPAVIWNVEDGQPARQLTNCTNVAAIQFSPDGRRVVAACDDKWARVLDVATGRLELNLGPHGDMVCFASFSHDGRLIVTASHDFTARIWDAQTGVQLAEMKHHSWVYYAAFSPDDKLVATASFDRTARVWTTNGTRFSPALPHHFGVSCVQYSPDGRLIATAGFDGMVRLWRADNFQPYEFCPVIRNGEPAICLAFSPDGRRIMTGGGNGTVRVWDLAPFAPVPVDAGYVVEPDGRKLLQVTNHAIPAWNKLTGTETPAALRSNPRLWKMEMSRNGKFIVALATAGNTTTNQTNWIIQVWDPNSGQPVAPALLLTNRLTDVSVSSDGRRLLTFGGTNAQVWDVLTQTPLFPPMAHSADVRMARFSPDDKKIVTAAGAEARVWNLTDGTLAFPPLNHPAGVEYVGFSPESTRIVTCCRDNELTPRYAQIWDAQTGRPIGPQLKHTDGVIFAAFSGDGLRLATGCEDHTANIWNCGTGRLLVSGLEHGDQINLVAFNSNNRWLITASADKTARVWNVDTGDPLTLPLPHHEVLSGAQFTTDGLHVITTTGVANGPTNSWIWDLPIDKRPADDLRRLAFLLSGGMAVNSTGLPEQAGSLELIWRELHEKNPADFSVPAARASAWHEFVAHQSEAEHDWFGAVFQLERLAVLRPGDATVATRLFAGRCEFALRQYELAGDWSGAVVELERLAALKPGDARIAERLLAAKERLDHPAPTNPK